MTNNNEKFGDAFKKGGPFADNIRISTDGDDEELRESMKAHGWIEEFPALSDEHDVILVGHRRLKIAEELGINPVVKKLVIGNGDEADAKRLRLAIASNIGHKPMTKEDRQRIAEYLYGEREWTMQRIADALNVGFTTVQRDLDNLSTADKLKSAKTTTNPKGAGRPKGSAKKPDKVPKEHYRQAEIAALYDEGLNNAEIAAELGLNKRIVDDVVEHERIKRAAQADPVIPFESLSMSAQQKCEAWKRQTEKQLRVEIEQQEREKVRKEWDEVYLPHYNKSLADAKAVVKARKGVFTKEQYNSLLFVFHPDPNSGIVTHHEAFILFTSKKMLLLSEKDYPVVSDHGIAKSREEMMRRYAEVAAARKAKRAASKNKKGGIQPQ